MEFEISVREKYLELLKEWINLHDCKVIERWSKTSMNIEIDSEDEESLHDMVEVCEGEIKLL